MNRFFFALALTALTTSTGHAFAQERIAKTGAVTPARTAAHTADAKKTAPAKPATAVKSMSGSGSTLTAPSTTSVVDSHTGGDLTDVRGTGRSSDGSGAEQREIAAVTVPTTTAVPRSIATPRLLRRMNADRVTMKLTEDFHACYANESGDKTADSAIVRLAVTRDGQVESAKVDSGAVASPAVSACVSAAASSAKFSAPGGIGTIVLVQVRAR